MELFIVGLIVGLAVALGGKSFVNAAAPSQKSASATQMDKLAGKADKQLKVVQQVQNELAEIDKKSTEAVKSFSQKIQDLLG